MTRLKEEGGFAIALLLWMIAGMALTVAAVIHFARHDTSAMELRLMEAKARALGRGVTLLALRDRAMAAHAPENGSLDVTESGREGGSPNEHSGQFTAQYAPAEGWSVTVTIRPSNGFISLNDAGVESLTTLFAELGGLEVADASRMAQGVEDYRYQYPGFRYREELLAVEGVSRLAYDQVKEFVHPFRSGQLDASYAAGPLSALANDSQGDDDNVSDDAPSTPGGLVTFESIAAEIEQRSGTPDATIVALEIDFSLDSGATLSQQIWASPERLNPILRTGGIANTTGQAP